jgi:16S rRNA A1518/A1519 N6-dimethyltransferase RsmA/KsgA/DIM1 with predicted DNA glycosylase/AP lyase activity
MMTAQWWPWFEFKIMRRVSASSFRPRPSVDGGLMTISRRADPLVADADRRRFQAMVHQVFTGRGHGIAQILARRVPSRVTRQWLRDNKVGQTHIHAICPLPSGLPCSPSGHLCHGTEPTACHNWPLVALAGA